MKKNRKYLWVSLVALFLVFNLQRVRAQSHEVQQLLLNVEKLSQLKNILKDMKSGYQLVKNGYNTIKDISQGNFSLHETFIDGLMLVNPEIKKYYKVAGIISAQKDMVSEYKSAFNSFSSSGNFNPSEIGYLQRVYKQLFDKGLDNLDELAMVITSSKLRMSDDERLQAIDRIYEDINNKLLFLRSFNKETSILNLQRHNEKISVQGIRKYYNSN
nr:TerB family tellurite resistance protein [uncultured Pedobacter sp.]